MNSAFLNFLVILWKTAGNNTTWRKFLYRQLRRSGKTPDYAFSRDFYGLKYRGNLNNNIDANVFFYGAFEKPLLFFLRDALNAITTEIPKPIFVDVGANVGQHSLFLSKFAWQVLAFEPYCKVSMQFKRQIAHNNISNIQIFENGLSDRLETLNYYAPTGNNEGIGSFDENSIIKGNKSYGKLELQEGDQVIESGSWNGIKLIKIDVERVCQLNRFAHIGSFLQPSVHRIQDLCGNPRAIFWHVQSKDWVCLIIDLFQFAL